MALNGFSLNSAALNRAALLGVLLYGATTATAGAIAAADVNRIVFSSVSATAGIISSVAPQHHRHANVAGSSSAVSLATANNILAGASIATAVVTSSAHIFNLWLGAVSATAGANGYAIPNSKLGTAALTAGADALCTAKKVQFLAASSTCGAVSNSPICSLVRYVVAAPISGCIGAAEWTYKPSGFLYWQHTGYIRATAGVIAAVDESKYKIVVGNGSIATAASSGIVVSKKTQHIAAVANIGAVSSVYAVRRAYVLAGNTASATASALANRRHMSTVSQTATATYSQAFSKVTQNQKAHAMPESTTFGGATGVLIKHAAAINGAAIVCSASAEKRRYGEAIITAGSSAVVTAFSNTEVPAPDDRSMAVPSDDRNMVVPFDDRLMRIAA